MDNVITFPSKEVEEVKDPVMNFITGSLIPWAETQGIDTSSKQFKLTGAGIMSLLQGLDVQ